MGHPSIPEMWYFYFKKESFQQAIDFYNVNLEQHLRDFDGQELQDRPTIGATPSHVYVKTVIDTFLYNDCETELESEIWYSQADFVETHECTRIYNPNKKWNS